MTESTHFSHSNIICNALCKTTMGCMSILFFKKSLNLSLLYISNQLKSCSWLENKIERIVSDLRTIS